MVRYISLYEIYVKKKDLKSCELHIEVLKSTYIEAMYICFQLIRMNSKHKVMVYVYFSQTQEESRCCAITKQYITTV